VFAVNANPIEIGLVASLNHPGANVTGVAGMAVGREHERLELLHAAIPTTPVLGLLLNPENSNRDVQTNDALASVQKVGVKIKIIRASAARDFSNVFAELTQSQAGGLVVADDEFFLSASVGLGSSGHGVPAIFQGTAFTAADGLMKLRDETDGALSPSRRL
jgi:putative tryptophan/tyrosine transport system substrate-binding protein